MNPKLKAIIIEYREFLNEKRTKARVEVFNLRALNENILKPSRT